MDMKEQSRMIRVTVFVAALVLLGSTFVARGIAEERREHREGERREHEVQRWREGDIRHFHERDFAGWRRGHWFHGEHFGRGGWWWVVDSVWYFYPAPVYPYPDPFVPPTVVVQAPPSPPTQAAPQYWYYCASAKGYYPYVSHCPEAWMQVVPQTTPPGH